MFTRTRLPALISNGLTVSQFPTTSFPNSSTYRLPGTPFDIVNTPIIRHHTILSNNWGVV